MNSIVVVMCFCKIIGKWVLVEFSLMFFIHVNNKKKSIELDIVITDN